MTPNDEYEQVIPGNLKRALELGWIEKRGAVYYVVPYHREELDAAYPGNSIYRDCLRPAPEL